MTDSGGSVAPGFEAVADAFLATLGASGGAAFAAVVDGEAVVDLWGGHLNEASPWSESTAVLLFSGTKGLLATCLLLLVERGRLDPDAPIARYWPGFRAKDVLVRHLAAHTAGLPGLRQGFSTEDLLDEEQMTEAVAAEPPFWPPGTRLAYHALTFGWLAAGLIRRVDGRSAGTFFAEELAQPLGLELWIGLPSGQSERVATLVPDDGYGITYLGDAPDPLLQSVYGGMLHSFPWNDPRFHTVEIPAVNGIGTARSIARLYGRLAAAGDGVLSPETVELGRRELSRGQCAVTKRPYAFGFGFELQTELLTFGSPLDAFGHTGSGGSVHGAWPSERVGFSYAMSELRAEAGDDRARRVLAALHDAVPAAS